MADANLALARTRVSAPFNGFVRTGEAPGLLAGVTATIGMRPRVEGGGLAPDPTVNPVANTILTGELLAGLTAQAPRRSVCVKT